MAETRLEREETRVAVRFLEKVTTPTQEEETGRKRHPFLVQDFRRRVHFPVS